MIDGLALGCLLLHIHGPWFHSLCHVHYKARVGQAQAANLFGKRRCAVLHCEVLSVAPDGLLRDSGKKSHGG